MSWCPKCRSEYINGRETCADCGSVLVESLDEIKDDAKEMYDFNSLSDDMKRRVLNEMKKQNIDPRLMFYKPAKEGTHEYLEQIIAEENSPSYEEYEKENASEGEQEVIEVPPAFVTKETKYKDYRSTGYSFLIVGTLGLLFMLSELTGITSFLSLSGGSRYLSFTVMILMFAGFIMVGIHAFASSKKLKLQADEENAYISALEDWIKESITATQINEGINQNLSIDDLYKLRSDKIRKQLLSHDADMDKSMLEHYIENTYIALFES